ncbi:TonB-dependent receptor [Cognaticolwellia mytili]|uniref:TonB-dependent receptor n=1 Tax=Cognaticolwellia mytili TaxID=1888913 RepID=UPI001F35FCA6|nr:TonB-dependent receptor [Cognaticolwellia mytili]
MSIHTALIFLLFSSMGKAADLVYFDIKQQNANQALILFGKQSQQTILFSFELTKKIQTNQVEGYYTVEFAIRKLLRGSGLEVIKNQDNVIAISATSKTKKTPNTEDVTSPASANRTAETAGIEKIAIVGSRTARRSITDLPVPVDILPFSQLKQSGQTNVGDMLQAIAPSFNFSKSAISDGSDVLQPATLRGLGPDQTLVLVNGKRRHQASLIHINNSVGRGTAGTDLNAIPVAAIKRIEILRDGAAAQYGSDAIAGVINIVLKDDTSADYVEASYGKHSQGDGASQQVEFSKSIALFKQGYANLSASVADHQATNRTGQYGSCIYDGCTQQAPHEYITSNLQEINAARDIFEIGNPEYLQQAWVINAGYDTGVGELYGFATYSKRDNTSAAFFRSAKDQATNPVLQDSLPTLPDGYLPKISSKLSDYSLNFGYNFEFDSGISVDTSYTYGKNKINYDTESAINASYANLLRFQENSTASKIRENIPQNAHAYELSLSLQTLNIDIRKDLDWATLTLGFEFRQDHYQVNAGEKYSYFDYDTLANRSLFANDAVAGIQGFPGVAPSSAVDEKRHVRSIYFEIEQQLLPNVFINTATRYDDYDGFGASTNLKVAAHWQSNDWLTYRGAISTGFRAPSMQQLYFNNTSTQFLVDDNDELVGQKVATFRNDSHLANAIGVPELAEESSKNLSLGAVVSFDNSLTLTVDYYRIDIDDRIVLSSGLCLGLNHTLDQLLAAENIDKAQVFLNGVDTKTQGIDIIATWQTSLAQGKLDLTLAANYTKTEVERLFTPSASTLNSLAVEEVFSAHDIAIIEDWQPESRINFNINYQLQQWRFNLTLNHFGKYSVVDGDKQTYGAKLLTDIRIEHQLTPNVQLYAGSNNLFNIYPDKNTIGNSRAGKIIDDAGNTIVDSEGVFQYSRRSAPFGYNGAYFYTGIAVNF